MYEIEPVGFVRVTVPRATVRIRRELDCRAAAVRPPRGSSAGVGVGRFWVCAQVCKGATRGVTLAAALLLATHQRPGNYRWRAIWWATSRQQRLL